jgi:4-amino-4-deoxy-L-arabinose transferase-like glycosyltransferase
MKKFLHEHKTVLLVALLAMGFLLRLSLYGPPITSDAAGYLDQATRLAEGEGFVTPEGRPASYRSPGYPFLLSLFLRVLDEHYYLIFAFQALLSVLTCLLIYSLAGRCYPGCRKQVIFLLSLLYLPFAYYAQALLAETVFVFLFLSSLWLLILSMKENRRLLLPAGIAAGLAALTKPFFVLILILLPLWPFLARKEHRRILWKKIFLFVLFALLTISPWTIRNYIRLDKTFLLISSQAPASFWVGLHPSGEGFGFSNWEEAERRKRAEEKRGIEQGWSSFFVQDSLRTIKREPLRVLKLSVVKFFYFFNPFDGLRYVPFSRYNIFWGLVFSLCCLSLLYWRRFSLYGRLPFFVAAIFLLNSVVFMPVPRYRLATEAFLLCSVCPAISLEKKKWLVFTVIGLNCILFVFSEQAVAGARAIADFVFGYSNIFR